MVARITTFEDVDVELSDRLAAFLASQDEDPFAGLPGYRGSLTLLDREGRRTIGIGFYASAAEAEEAAVQLETLYPQLAQRLPEDLLAITTMEPSSTALCEVQGELPDLSAA